MSEWPKRLKLARTKLPDLESVRVAVPAIEYDDALGCFFVGINAEDGSVPMEVRDLPANFHTHELMDVDPTDPTSLLEFQRSWGILTSVLREPLVPSGNSFRNAVIASPKNRIVGQEEYEEAVSLLEKLDGRNPGISLAYRWMLSAVDGIHTYPFVPYKEAADAVATLREYVSAIVEAVTDGYGKFPKASNGGFGYELNQQFEEPRVLAICNDVIGAITPYFPPVKIVTSNVSFEYGVQAKAPDTPILPLSVAALSQLMGYATSARAASVGYRTCKRCGRYFVFKRHLTGDFVRSRRSEYCSDECKAKADAKSQAARRKQQRHEDKARRLRGGEANGNQ